MVRGYYRPGGYLPYRRGGWPAATRWSNMYRRPDNAGVIVGRMMRNRVPTQLQRMARARIARRGAASTTIARAWMRSRLASTRRYRMVRRAPYRYSR